MSWIQVYTDKYIEVTKNLMKIVENGFQGLILQRARSEVNSGGIERVSLPYVSENVKVKDL